MSVFDEDRPAKKTVHDIGCDLSLLSADELRARVNLLKEEISRLEREFLAKTASRSAAESLFKN